MTKCRAGFATATETFIVLATLSYNKTPLLLHRYDRFEKFHKLENTEHTVIKRS